MENLQQLQKLAQIFNADKIITPQDIDEILKGILTILSSYKKGTEEINNDTKQTVNSMLLECQKMMEEHDSKVENEKEEEAKERQSLLDEVKAMVEQVKSCMPEDGKDGKDADEEKIVEEVLSKIVLPEYKETIITGEEVIDKINELPLTEENQIEFARIKNVPIFKGKGGHSPTVISNAVDLDQSARADGYAVVWDGTRSRFKFAAGSGSPGGSDTQLQYNNAGSFGGISGATTNGTAVTYTASNLIAADVTASGSGGFLIQSNNGTDVGLFGAGGGSNASFYGGVNITGDLTVDTNVLDVDTTNNRVGINTATPAYDLTLGAGNASGIAVHRLADETNFEAIRIFWSGTTALIRSEKGGTGTDRSISIRQGTSGGSIGLNGSSPWVSLGMSATKTAAGTVLTECANHTVGGTSGTLYSVSMAPTISQSSTAGYTALLINPTETTTGSGTKLLTDWQVGGSSKAVLNNTGSMGLGTSTLTSGRKLTIAEGTMSSNQNGGIDITGDISGNVGSNGLSMTLTNTTATNTGFLRLDRTASSAFVGMTLSSTSRDGIRVLTHSSTPVEIARFASTFAKSSGTDIAFQITPAINQSSTAGYTGLLVNATETSTGSGSKLLADFQVGGSSKASISNAGLVTAPQIVNTPATITVTANAGTVTRANRINNFTNSSAAAMTITMSTTSAADGDIVMVRIKDFSAVAQTITWVNTENSSVSVPATSNGSTTLPLTVGFQYNSATSKWRCIMNV